MFELDNTAFLTYLLDLFAVLYVNITIFISFSVPLKWDTNDIAFIVVISNNHNTFEVDFDARRGKLR